ncbi:sugar phosphate isomerase/epimerase [Pseudoruegeria sp. HB172150]|uniref:sugar phosphate isomerase/epimerase family protein n=1 Tax=Pseudoruegeria sp. HB172150 TaxID=2721164 RepID=UPI0015576648|nr:sugar phosphate isomerase/epimerase family protein [Pseudoruegeria sp. HB172150]
METCITCWHLPNHPRWFDEGIRHSLAEIAHAGFTHVNWNPDAGYSYVYAPSETDHIAGMLEEAGLKAWSVHGSHGKNNVSEVGAPHNETRKDFLSPHEWQRQAGLDLIRNRLEFCRRIGSPNVVMHVDLDEAELRTPEGHKSFYDRFHRSFDEIAEDCVRTGVRVAVENLTAAPIERILEMFGELFDRHPPEVAGLCYDCGHAELADPGNFRILEDYGHRLIATHLHDNRSVRDDHLLPHDGNIDWDRLISLISATPYEPPMNFETPYRVYGMGYSLGEAAFYQRAHQRISALEFKLAEVRAQAAAA